MGPDGDLCHKLPAPKELFHLNGSILPVPGIELLVPEKFAASNYNGKVINFLYLPWGTFNYKNQSLL